MVGGGWRGGGVGVEGPPESKYHHNVLHVTLHDKEKITSDTKYPS